MVIRDLVNSRFGVSYSNFSFLTPTFWKVSIDKYGKTPAFSGGQYFTPIFKILVRTLVIIREFSQFLPYKHAMGSN